MTRVRSAAQRAPQTIEAATDLAGRFAELDAQLARIEADRQDELAKINGAADAAIVPIVAELKDIAKQLKPWWAAHFETLTDGKRKSIELGETLREAGFGIGQREDFFLERVAQGGTLTA